VPLIVIPLVSFVSAIVLVSFNDHQKGSVWLRVLSLLSGCISFLLVLITGFFQSSPSAEYQFSPLFNLPGMPEILTFSLYPDSLSMHWLLGMTFASLLIYILGFADRSGKQTTCLAALHLTQAGLTIFFLSGSLISGTIGWGITLSAVLFALGNRKISHEDQDSSNFTILMISVFILLFASFVIYGVIGRLSYSNSPESLGLLMNRIMGIPPNPLVAKLLTLISLSLIFAVIPGMGLMPFSSWLSETREMNSLSALFIYINVMPAGVIIIQRYYWLMTLSPSIVYLVYIICAISIVMSYIAVFSQRGTRLTMLWLAIICSGLLLGVQFQGGTSSALRLFKIIYPGLFLFGFGRVLEHDFKAPSGRYFQATGVALPFFAGVYAILSHSDYSDKTWISVVLPIILYSVPAFRIFRLSGDSFSDKHSISLSFGWSAYNFFGTRRFIEGGVLYPVQQLADGFLALESFLNFVIIHGLSRMICNWGRLLWSFDKWFIDGSLRWLKIRKTGSESLQKKIHDRYCLLVLICIGAVSLVIRN